MAYTLTIDTGVQVVNKNGETAQMVIVFTNSASGDDVTWNAKEHGIRVAEWRDIDWNYDVEDALLVPGTYSAKLFDANYELRDVLFGTSTPNTTFAKNAEVTIWLNGSVDYIGNMQEDSISYDVGERSVQFTCDPDTAILNKSLLFDTDNVTPLNPFGLTDAYYYSITWLLEQMYKLVSDTISYPATLEVKQNWTFRGLRCIPSDNLALNTLAFTELQQMVHPLFFDPAMGLVTVGDVLKKLAIDWCCFTGLIHKDRAFFRKLFYYDSFNTQTLLKVQNRILGYRYGLIDYVDVSVDPGTPVHYYKGTNTHLEGRSIERQLLPGFLLNQSWTNIKAVNGTGTYNIYGAGDPSLLGGAQVSNGQLVSEFWYNFRSNILHCRVDKITASGIGYDFLKNFTDDNRDYQAVGMKKKIADSLTEIDAIYLGTEYGEVVIEEH